jgi:hypothetical protein
MCAGSATRSSSSYDEVRNMRPFSIVGLALALAYAQAVPALAAAPNPLGGPMAKCAPGDPAVIVNTTRMTYSIDTKADRSAMKGRMNDDKFVCRSTALKMGAKLRRGSMTMPKPAGGM